MEKGGDCGKELGELYVEMARPLSECLARAMDGTLPAAGIEEVMTGSWEAFRQVLPDIPDIGGENNPLSEDLAGAAFEMGFYALMEARGFSLEAISEIDKKATADLARRKIGKVGLEAARSSVTDIDSLRWGAEAFRKMGYPDNWAYEVVEPRPGDSFDIGIDYTRCPIAALFRKKGMEKFLPCVCENDYPAFAEMGITLERTRTIGSGFPVCDFRFRFNEAPPCS